MGDRELYTTYYHMYKEPLEIVRAQDQYCYDAYNKEYIDLYNNVYHVGYCNKRIADAVYNQMTHVVTNTRYVHPVLAEYSKELLATFPAELELDTCFFVNSGSEANDLAMRLAKSASGTSSHRICYIEGAYHGTTDLCNQVSSSVSTGLNKYGEQYKDDDSAGNKFICIPRNGSLVDLDLDLDNEAEIHAAPYNFIHETIQGVAGQIIFDGEFLPNIYRKIRSTGGLCIADEVQTGFGRTGHNFWAFQYYDLDPDIVTLGKGIGNGFPLGCVITKRAIANTLGTYFNTYGGNPVSCIAGLTTLKIVNDLQLQDKALELGDYMLTQLQNVVDKYNDKYNVNNKNPIAVRGRGLFIGIEFPSEAKATAIFETMRERGFLLGIGGPDHNIIRIKPPMVITKVDIDKFIGTFQSLL